MTFREKQGGAQSEEIEPDRDEVTDGGARPAEGASFKERHQLSYADELKRKSVHLVALLIPLGIWVLGGAVALTVLATLSVLAIVADLLRVRSRGFARFLYRLVGFMMRPEECPRVGDPVVLNGATWVLLSATLLLILFHVNVAILAFTAFMIGDAAAAIIGRRWGRRRWGRTTRTAEGSAAFLIVSVFVMLSFGWIPASVAILASIAGAAAEIPSRPLNDNIRVPLVTGAVITLAGLLMG